MVRAPRIVRDQTRWIYPQRIVLSQMWDRPQSQVMLEIPLPGKQLLPALERLPYPLQIRHYMEIACRGIALFTMDFLS